MILGFIFVTLSNICSTIIPRLVGLSIDTIESGNFEMLQIWEYIGMILAFTAGSGIFMFLTRQTIIVTSRLIEYDLRNDYLLSIETYQISFFHEIQTGTLMSYATNDIAAARDFLGPAIMYGANQLLILHSQGIFLLKCSNL